MCFHLALLSSYIHTHIQHLQVVSKAFLSPSQWYYSVWADSGRSLVEMPQLGVRMMGFPLRLRSDFQALPESSSGLTACVFKKVWSSDSVTSKSMSWLARMCTETEEKGSYRSPWPCSSGREPVVSVCSTGFCTPRILFCACGTASESRAGIQWALCNSAARVPQWSLLRRGFQSASGLGAGMGCAGAEVTIWLCWNSSHFSVPVQSPALQIWRQYFFSSLWGNAAHLRKPSGEEP